MKETGEKIINCCPFDILLYHDDRGTTFDGYQASPEYSMWLNHIGVWKYEGKIPDKKKNVKYIVQREVALLHPSRKDLIYPKDILSFNGAIMVCRSFSK